MPEEWVFQYERFGFKFTLYKNRIEVRERGMLAWKSDTLLLRSITAVEVGLGGKLRLTLADGKKREYVLGLKAEEGRQALLALL
jgi:hypothetical protein